MVVSKSQNLKAVGIAQDRRIAGEAFFIKIKIHLTVKIAKFLVEAVVFVRSFTEAVFTFDIFQYSHLMNGDLIQLQQPFFLRHALIDKTAFRFSIFDKQINSLIVA